MKQTFTFLLLLVVSSSWAQHQPFQCANASLKEVLERVEESEDIHFSYAVRNVAGRVVNLDVQGLSRQAFLDTLLHPLGLQAVAKSAAFYTIETYSKSKRVVLKVADAMSQEPLAFAHFRLGNKPFGTALNGDGELAVSSAKLKGSSLMLSYVGYQKVVLQIDSTGSLPDTLKIPMQRLLQGLEEVVILEYLNRAIVVKDDYSTTTLLIQEMEVLPGLPEPDVLLSTQMLPGVESSDETASGLNFRGGARDQTLIYWDRIPVYHAAHYFGSITSFIPSTVQEVEVYRNYIPANFSGASSGLLNIKSFQEVTPSISGGANLTSTHLDAHLNVPLGNKLSLMVAGRNSYNHRLETPTFQAYSDKLFDGSKVGNLREQLEEDDELEYLSQLIFRDINAKVIWKPSQKDMVSASMLINSNGLNFNSDDEEFERKSFQFHDVSSLGFSLYHQRKWSSKWETEVSATIADYSMEHSSKEVSNEEGDSSSQQLDINNHLVNTELQLKGRYKPSERWQAEVGYQFNGLESDLFYLEKEDEEPDFEDTVYTQGRVHGAFVGMEWSLGKLVVAPQFRLDFWEGKHEQMVLPKPVLHTRYELSKGLGLKASYGHYSQYIRAIDDPSLNVTNVSESIWIVSDDDDIGLMRNRQLTLGFLFQRKGWLIDADLYYKRMDGLLADRQNTESIDTEIEFADGLGRVRGLDLMLRKKFKNYSAWVSYSRSKSIVFFEEYGSDGFPDFTDRPHQLRIVNTFNHKRLQMSLGWTYKSGNPYTRPDGLRLVEEDDESYYVPNWEQINQARMEDYHRMDLSLWYNFSPNESKWVGKAGFSVLNLYGRDNIWRRSFYAEPTEEDERVFEIVEEERFFLGFTPSFSLSISF